MTAKLYSGMRNLGNSGKDFATMTRFGLSGLGGDDLSSELALLDHSWG